MTKYNDKCSGKCPFNQTLKQLFYGNFPVILQPSISLNFSEIFLTLDQCNSVNNLGTNCIPFYTLNSISFFGYSYTAKNNRRNES